MKRERPDRAKRLAHISEEYPDIFVVRLNKLIDELDVSMGEISIDIGCGRDVVASYIRGKRMPNARTLLNLCRYLNVSADWLLGLSNERRAVW